MKIRTKEFIRTIARKAEVTNADARKVCDAISEVVKEEVAKENAVTIFKGLVVYGKRTEPRLWDNPLIGGTEELPSRVIPKARFSDEFKQELKELTM